MNHMADQMSPDHLIQQCQVNDWDEKGMNQEPLGFNGVNQNFLELLIPITFSQGIRRLIKNNTFPHFHMRQNPPAKPLFLFCLHLAVAVLVSRGTEGGNGAWSRNLD